MRALDTINVRRMAADYSAAVRAALTPLQLAMVQSGERVEHDYIDANDAVYSALQLQLPGADMQDHSEAINNAVDRAAAAGFELRRVLIACEFSGIVRDAFAARGHDAISADLLETEQPGPHYVGDAREIMNDGYHLMIAHPPCTFLCNSSLKHLKPGGVIDPVRFAKMEAGAELFNDFGAADVAQICRENPIPHGEARERIGRPDQYIQTYDFGHDHSKKTGLWLDELPLLEADPALHVEPRIIQYNGKPAKRWANQSPCGADNTPESPNRWRIRSRFFQGIADAMATQWGIA